MLGDGDHTLHLLSRIPKMENPDSPHARVAMRNHILVCGCPTSIREFMAPLRSGHGGG
eukprot:CAMPEP_0179440128 /NCGR_PEP_ID=MMETSP0799-20121207/23720_1 /TAXON_ID=46947 /ORGANISM="Geminigera cryophila, Strain CCMP2564" /LENGTH=57 /DNA_ID=CAMNT_0021223153 /DNA_START=157 /DNA_END=327 /DNA_ORIENTATION=+